MKDLNVTLNKNISLHPAKMVFLSSFKKIDWEDIDDNIVINEEEYLYWRDNTISLILNKMGFSAFDVLLPPFYNHLSEYLSKYSKEELKRILINIYNINTFFSTQKSDAEIIQALKKDSLKNKNMYQNIILDTYLQKVGG